MKRLLLSLSLTLALAANASAGTIDFNTIMGPTGSYINDVDPNYAGYTWGTYVKEILGTSGNGGVIGAGAVFTQWDYNVSMSTSSTHFDFLSAYLTPREEAGIGVTVEGYRDGSLVASTTINNLGDVGTPHFFSFDGFSDIDTLWFNPLNPTKSLGGIDYAGQIIIDDINVSTVPEPSSLILLGAGLIGAYALKRRKNK